MNYARVVLETNIPLGKNQFFTYELPEGNFQVGQEVIAPFRSALKRGIIWKIEAKKPTFPTKKIKQSVDSEIILDNTHRKLALYISDYYHCSLGSVVKLMLSKRIKRVSKIKKKVFNNKLQEQKIKLSFAQNKALKAILEGKGRVFLLHGVTGSGKTEIYLRLCKEAIEKGQQAIILVPEISLTDQAIIRFNNRFPGKIAVLHSRLTNGEKFRAWERIRTCEAKIVIGPRSAIFAPVKNLGLIVLDEEHDSSFKQYDQNPRYHAREVALFLAKVTKAKLILGSATPAVETYYAAITKRIKVLELPERVNNRMMPNVEIVDMRYEFKQKNLSVASRRLKEELNKIIVQKKQAILFVNRRGLASFVFCRDCGFTLKCPNCEVSLTYHIGSNEGLLCHYCNYHIPSPAFCPNCQSPYIKYFGLGTQKVEEEIKNLFPKANVSRFDRDATSLKGAQSAIYRDFSEHRIDILIGTQMLAQGWDLPKVALIGIIAGDADLNLPDFRASERTFNLLTQVAGRTGRGDEIGKVILQTYNPDNPIIRAASKHNYKTFYKSELENRRELSFPPFTHLIKLIYQDQNKEKAEKKILKLTEIFQDFFKLKKIKVNILGPAAAFISKIRGRYRYQIILMLCSKELLFKKEMLNLVPDDFIIDVDPESLL